MNANETATFTWNYSRPMVDREPLFDCLQKHMGAVECVASLSTGGEYEEYELFMQIAHRLDNWQALATDALAFEEDLMRSYDDLESFETALGTVNELRAFLEDLNKVYADHAALTPQAYWAKRSAPTVEA